MQAVAMMYPSQYRKYMLAWNEAYAVNPEYFNDSGFRWLAKHAKRVGGSYKTSNGMIFRVFFPIYIEPALPPLILKPLLIKQVIRRTKVMNTALTSMVAKLL